MNYQELTREIKSKKSFLCIGLDTDIEKIPAHLRKMNDPIVEFNKQIIDATHDLCVAYKPNIAFYEQYGSMGWESLHKTVEHIPTNILKIADAKRGDIGNTAEKYAHTFFNQIPFDAVTLAPYMGKDSITPFLQHRNKWSIILALTSNKGSEDFQLRQSGEYLFFEQVLHTSKAWGNKENTMYVVGATHPEMFINVRKIVPDHFLLVPGVGAQGGNIIEICKYGLNKNVGLLINSSRNIIYAGNEKDFAKKARATAIKIQQEMEEILSAI